MNKVAMKFDKVFWKEDTESIGYTSSIKGQYRWFFRSATGTNVFLGFLTSKLAEELEPLSDEEIVSRLMGVLRKIYGPDVPDPVAYTVTRWGSDPFSRGAYSSIKFGATSDDYDVMAQPVERLLFAGEATSKDFPGYAHGAYVSGLREAHRILKIY